ncbi:MAG TPA: DUF4242 domain-containing protein [Dehalococcoidia bacterium]|nr:DUF4242 domain-containing protein [Dehalococcoidia bacterium]
MMPLYLVRRELPGATREDIDAASFRAIACAFTFEGLRWISSYWDADAGRIHCVYEAQSPQQIEDHSRRARIPCDEIRPVDQVLPEQYSEELAGQGNASQTA